MRADKGCIRQRHLALGVSSLLICMTILWVFAFRSMTHEERKESSNEHSSSKTLPQATETQALVFPVQEEISRIRIRDDFGDYLEELGYKTGAELGVQDGWFVKETLPRWKSVQKYILVDIWRQQTNYVDAANRPNDVQEAMYQKLLGELRAGGWSDKIKVMRMLTKEAANEVPDESLDYVYVDARHDYCGCKEDMDRWWPKLRPGGLLAGPLTQPRCPKRRLGYLRKRPATRRSC
jgi:hypothetical protein